MCSILLLTAGRRCESFLSSSPGQLLAPGCQTEPSDGNGCPQEWWRGFTAAACARHPSGISSAVKKKPAKGWLWAGRVALRKAGCSHLFGWCLLLSSVKGGDVCCAQSAAEPCKSNAVRARCSLLALCLSGYRGRQWDSDLGQVGWQLNPGLPLKSSPGRVLLFRILSCNIR